MFKSNQILSNNKNEHSIHKECVIRNSLFYIYTKGQDNWNHELSAKSSLIP